MALSHSLISKKIARHDRDTNITGRLDYHPVESVSKVDNSTQLATTEFVNDYSYPITNLGTVSGDITLETDKMYAAIFTNAISIRLEMPADTMVGHRIKVYVERGANVTAVNWGTSSFVYNQMPSLNSVTCIVFYDWNPIKSAWVCGVLQSSGVMEGVESQSP